MKQQYTHSLRPCSAWLTCHQWNINCGTNERVPARHAKLIEQLSCTNSYRGWVQRQFTSRIDPAEWSVTHASNIQKLRWSSSPTIRHCCQKIKAHIAANGCRKSAYECQQTSMSTANHLTRFTQNTKGAVWTGIRYQIGRYDCARRQWCLQHHNSVEIEAFTHARHNDHSYHYCNRLQESAERGKKKGGGGMSCPGWHGAMHTRWVCRLL